MKTIILVPGLNSLCPNLLGNRSLPRHPAGSPRESSSWTPSSCPQSPCPPAHPSPTPQVSRSFSLNHRSSSFISCSSLRGWFGWGPIPITQKSTVSRGRPYLSAAYGLAKSTERELGKRRELSEGTRGNGAGKREFPMFPNSFKPTGTGVTARAARQGSASGNRPKSTLPKTCSIFA